MNRTSPFMKTKRLKTAKKHCQVPSKPLRRSPRLLEKNDKTLKVNFWLHLPVEIKFQIFSFLNAEALGKLALSSRELSYDIQTFLQTIPGLYLIRKDLLADSSVIFNEKETCRKIKNCRTLGLLFKAATFSLEKSSRFFFAYTMIELLGWHWEAQGNELWEGDSYFMCFGEFLHALTLKWSRPDLQSIFPYIQKLAGMDRVILEILLFGPGRFQNKEKSLRSFFKYVYFMPYKRVIHKFWLTNLLKSLTPREQARILYILFGTTRSGDFISWCAPLANNCLAPYHEILQMASFISMIGEHEEYRVKKVLPVIEELTILPQPWHPAHIVYLILGCGPKYIQIYMDKIYCFAGYKEFTLFVKRCLYLSSMAGTDAKSLSEALMNVYDQHPEILEVHPDHLSTVLDPKSAFNFDERELWSGRLYLNADTANSFSTEKDPRFRCPTPLYTRADLELPSE